MAEPQKDGQYPRVNGAMIASRKYDGMIVSVVGKFMAEHPNHEGLIEFQAADQQKILFTTDQGTFPQNVSDPPYWEVVGQVMEDGTVAVRRTLPIAPRTCRGHAQEDAKRSLSLTQNLSSTALYHARTFQRHGHGDL